MSAEFVAISREFAKALTAAAYVLENAAAAEERMKLAERRAHEAKLAVSAERITIAKEKSDHTAELERMSTAHAASLKAADDMAARRHAEHEGFIESAKENVRRAGARLDSLNKEVAELIKRRDELSAQVASLKATITDIAGNL